MTERLPRHRESLLVAIGFLAVLHVVVLCAPTSTLLRSNLIQLAAPIIAVFLCVGRRSSAEQQFFKQRWLLLAAAFLVWALAQAGYLWFILTGKAQPPFPNLMDCLWLFFSFPVLLVASRGQEKERGDITDVLDFVQGCVSVAILFAVLLARPVGMTDSLIYDIQGLGLFLACALRYLAATNRAERVFFKGLTAFAGCYAVISAAGLFAQDYGSHAGGFTDLAWSLPVLIFCAIVLRLPEKPTATSDTEVVPSLLPPHIHGVASMGIALTSIGAGIVLAQYRLKWGIPSLIVSVIVFTARTAIRESQLRKAQLESQFFAFHDSLTGLANRASLFRELEQLGCRDLEPKALLFLDLDGFKSVNDTHGHELGDRLLNHVAQVLQSSIRTQDTVARNGGDEFVVILREAQGQYRAEAVASRILGLLQQPIMLQGIAVTISGSIGIATCSQGEASMDLLRRADAAMYRAKALGRNRAHMFDRSMTGDIQTSPERSLELQPYQG